MLLLVISECENGKHNFRFIAIAITNYLSIAEAHKRRFEFNVQLQYGQHSVRHKETIATRIYRHRRSHGKRQAEKTLCDNRQR